MRYYPHYFITSSSLLVIPIIMGFRISFAFLSHIFRISFATIFLAHLVTIIVTNSYSRFVMRNFNANKSATFQPFYPQPCRRFGSSERIGQFLDASNELPPPDSQSFIFLILVRGRQQQMDKQMNHVGVSVPLPLQQLPVELHPAAARPCRMLGGWCAHDVWEYLSQ